MFSPCMANLSKIFLLFPTHSEIFKCFPRAATVLPNSECWLKCQWNWEKICNNFSFSFVNICYGIHMTPSGGKCSMECYSFSKNIHVYISLHIKSMIFFHLLPEVFFSTLLNAPHSLMGRLETAKKD